MLFSTIFGRVQETVSLPASNPLVGDDGLGSGVGAAVDLLVEVGFHGAALVGLVAVLVRFRRSRGDERQQLKWFLSAAALAVAAAFAPVDGLIVRAVLVSVPVPVAVGIAILRYRLYDIDRLINRTVVYGVLTACSGSAMRARSWYSASCSEG